MSKGHFCFFEKNADSEYEITWGGKRMKQLVFTTDACVGCNRCIGECSCQGANVARNVNGKNVIEIDADKCIACGACFDVCEHNARGYGKIFFRFTEW